MEKAAHIAEQKVNEAKQLRLAAEEFSKAKNTTIPRVDFDVKLIQANVLKDAVTKWGGDLSASIVLQGFSMLFGPDKTIAK